VDTFTHGIVGALVGKAFFAGRDVPAGSAESTQPHSETAPTARAAIAACTLGSIFPDIDTFAGPIARNPLAIMEWHRNITHSLVMLPVWAVLGDTRVRNEAGEGFRYPTLPVRRKRKRMSDPASG
jgi:membrane-bound metal-dependent hydrolase YbcI (DUF457 family)